MKQASLYSKHENLILCHLCPHSCKIPEGKTGICGVRINKGGKLYSLVYGKPVAVHIDPVEKKPLFHFLPGEKALSIGTLGCNLKCLHCQNWDISQKRDLKEIESIKEVSPKEIVELAVKNKCRIIAYTYNEPTIFFEYMKDIAVLAKNKGIKNIIVSNGFTGKEALQEMVGFIDAANIDLKGFGDDFYKKTCSARLEPVLETLKFLKKNNVWLEITNLIIPTLNDEPKEIKEMCIWIKENLGADVPLHFSAFHPDYKLAELSSTPVETLNKAFDIAKKAGLNYVYLGNVFAGEKENTFCHSCGQLLIERAGFRVVKNILKNSRCPGCNSRIAGIF
ncbi:MAG: AmmeMemoRadiSam system radical SAM enzyme [Candidatus Woesearchaeota archaeon]